MQTITHAGAVRPGDVLISVNGHSSARGITVDRVEITPLGDVRIFGTKHNSIESKLFYRGIRQNLQVVLQRGTRPANALDVAPAVELSVRQIRRDIANGRVPVTVDMPHSATTGDTTRETHVAAILATLETIAPGSALQLIARDSVTNTFHWEVSL